ncbi:hypothetical protein Tco_0374809 [Tanacetum coccineum]
MLMVLTWWQWRCGGDEDVWWIGGRGGVGWRGCSGGVVEMRMCGGSVVGVAWLQWWCGGDEDVWWIGGKGGVGWRGCSGGVVGSPEYGRRRRQILERECALLLATTSSSLVYGWQSQPGTAQPRGLVVRGPHECMD